MPRLIRQIAAVLLIAALGTSAWAVDLGTAKSQGLVGERADGFLQPMGSAGADVKALVNDINAKRRAAYADIAKKNNVSIDQVGRLTAPKAFSESPPGTYIETASGWQRK